MKIGIVGFFNLNIMQYVYKYTNVLDQAGAEYDVIYWNRLGIKELKDFSGAVIPYNVLLDSYLPFQKKVTHFINYIQFVKKVIKQKRYDKLIILTSQAAVPLYGMLCGQYKEKYIYDYRDVTKENKIPGYKLLVQNLIRNSYCTMMSSRGFLRVVGMEESEKIQFDHNTRKAEKSMYHVRLNVDGTAPIRVSFWGQVRQIELNKWLCDQFGNDSRFRLTFHGGGDIQKLKDYCAAKEYKNIVFMGVYDLLSIKKFAEKTDILHCIYENDEVQKYAMPVKAYDAIKYKLPILIHGNSQVAHFYKDVEGALCIDSSDKDVADKVFQWYQNLRAAQVEKDYERLEDKVYRDDLKFEKTLKEFFHGEDFRK